jgi:hypothetical protein
MELQKKHIEISPIVIINKTKEFIYTASTETVLIPDPTCCDLTSFTENVIVTTATTKVQLSMGQILSGGTDGVSTLTDLSIPILLTQTFNDIGYYDLFDGGIYQKDVVNNFIYSSTTENPYDFYFYNTSEKDLKKYLKITNYYLDWGDGSPITQLTSSGPILHNYPNGQTTYTISLSGVSIWGITVSQSIISTPYTLATPSNPNGTYFFIPNSGSWSGIPVSYEYITNYDDSNNINDYVGSNFVTTPIILSSQTKSSLTDLLQYGTVKYKQNQQVKVLGDVFGTYWGRSNTDPYVSYTIDGVDYYDYDDGTTMSIVQSSGLIPQWLTMSGITKQEALMNSVDPIQIQSNVFIERGRVSPFERIERLGEVTSTGGITKYGYKFFNVQKF